MWLCAHECRSLQVQRALISLKVELQVARSCLTWMLRIKLRSSEITVHALNHCAISLAHAWLFMWILGLQIQAKVVREEFLLTEVSPSPTFFLKYAMSGFLT